VPLKRGKNTVKSYAEKDVQKIEDQYDIIAEY
jgi:hypothetical protein